MKNGGRSMGKTVAIFDDCYNLACEFPLTIFDHYSRVANDVAHELARMARRVPYPQFQTRWSAQAQNGIGMTVS